MREGLRAAGMAESPKALADLVVARGGEAVTLQAAHRWIRGQSIPRRRTLRALADLVGVTPEWLLGEEPAQTRRLGETKAGLGIDPRDRIALDAYLALPTARRRLIRELIQALSAND